MGTPVVQNWIAIIAESYLLGSIPFGYLLVRVFRGEDVRETGSGNIGATNVARKSRTLGVLTLVLDALKGTVAVEIARVIGAQGHRISPERAMVVAAFFAIVGHMFPLWLRFRGGKGVATALGAYAFIAPKALLIVLGVFLVVLWLFRYVSLASIISIALFPVTVCALRVEVAAAFVLGFISAASLLIIARHHQNIGRLIAGTENRFGARRK